MQFSNDAEDYAVDTLYDNHLEQFMKDAKAELRRETIPEEVMRNWFRQKLVRGTFRSGQSNAIGKSVPFRTG